MSSNGRHGEQLQQLEAPIEFEHVSWEESIQQYPRGWTQENQKHRTHPVFVYFCFFQQSLSFSFTLADTVQRKYM